MKFVKTLSAAALLACLAIPAAPVANAETVVRVTLIDKMGSGDDLGKANALGMGMKADMGKAKMGIAVNPKQAAPGDVRFDVVNLASTLVHEVQITLIMDDSKPLDFDQGRNKIDTERLQVLGSVSEIEPTKGASLILNLAPGKYLLFCNIAGHYMAGMWTIVDVK